MLSNTKPETYKRTGILIGLIVLVLSAYLLGSMAALPEEFGIIPLALVLGFFGALIILIRPFIGFALMFFLVPFGPVTRVIGGERAITLALAAALIGIYGSKVLILHEKIKFDRISVLASLFLGWSLVTSLWAYEPATSLSYVVRLGQMIALYVLVLNYCRSQRHLDILTLSFAAGAMVAAFWALFKGRYFVGRLLLSNEFNINFFSAMLSTGMILMCYHYYRSTHRLLKVLLALGVLAVGISIVLVQSRGVWIGISASLLISIFVTTKNPRIIRNTIIIAAVLIGLVVAVYYSGLIKSSVSESVSERFETLFSGDYEAATAGRTDIWTVGLEIVKDSFPLGVGFANFKIAYKHRVPRITGFFIHSSGDPHNTFLGILAETGLVGFTLFMGIFVHLFRNIWHITDPVTRFILMWLLGSMTLMSLAKTNHFSPWFWFVLLIVALSANLERQTNQKVLLR